jgi:hypothetical protein
MPTVHCFFVALMLAAGVVAQSGDGQRPPQFFMGWPIMVTESKTGEDGNFAQARSRSASTQRLSGSAIQRRRGT